MVLLSVLHSVFVMFLLIVAGYLTFMFKIVNSQTLQSLTSFLILIVSPVVIVYSFQLKIDATLIHGLIVAVISAFTAHIVTVILSILLFIKQPRSRNYKQVLRFAVVYSNCGFVGIPLLTAVVGPQGAFFASVYIAVFTIFLWTHGVFLFTGKADRSSLKKILLNPNLIAVVIGVLLFFLKIQIPSVLNDGFSYIYNLNTPLAMIVIGASLGQVGVHSIFNDKWVWPGIALKNSVFPVIGLFALHAAGISGMLLLCCFIPIACPVAGNIVLIPAMYEMDTEFPTKLMSLSTLFSVISMPAVISLIAILHF